MHLRRLVTIGLVLVLLIAALAVVPAAPRASAAAALPSYTLTDLGTLGGSQSAARAINASGQVVGSSSTAAGKTHAFLYSGGAMRDLGTLGGDFSEATGINASGQVVGTSQGADGGTYGFLLTDDDTMIKFGQLKPNPYTNGDISLALGINDAGQVVGSSDAVWGWKYAFLSSGDGMTDLSPAGAGFEGNAADINNTGQIVGWIYDGTSTGNHAYSFGAGRSPTPLGTLPPGDYSLQSAAYAINDLGVAVGYGSTATWGPAHAVMFSNGTVTDLGFLEGGDRSDAYGINNAGQVVGYSTAAGGRWHAFVHDGTRMFDLNTLVVNGAGWELNVATGINDLGQIVGRGLVNVGLANEQERAFLLTPTSVPPPAPPSAPPPAGRTIMAGDGIEIVPSPQSDSMTITDCTAGFTVTKNSMRYMLTADHCRARANVVSVYPDVVPIDGVPDPYAFAIDCSPRTGSVTCLRPPPGSKPNDILAWRPDPGVVQPTAQLRVKSGNNPIPDVYIYPVLGTAGWVPGETVCYMGRTSWTETCATIDGFESGSVVMPRKLVRMEDEDDGCAQGGDSGGPVYRYEYGQDGSRVGVWAVGIIEACGGPSNTVTWFKRNWTERILRGEYQEIYTYFMPIATAERLLGVKVLAGP